ncbi:ABC transporter ATP-binding protein [Desulfomonile tiedjei]|uniref:Amino acid/amide ABC transporter ATP-binding protein 1, HAAT family n=1 Tax=Desulfomonile tiedjei (strain ATCC 49306 / DSM 6799 / DCB-1) TaxID=706587 RepID=I4C555_DESTA|nr:ABC transporter ATP-binding protein [Desulfomonile tiedjei]AFM24696.1 amino acid/amide ABC transporter ATP-binding protein 1, HAAT family [Desulfomonile tiedjei DSM 6799]
MNAALLEVRDLNKAFGNVVTARNLSFSLADGTLTSIIGPNGAGKSTLINILSGSIPPDSGEILFQGQDITRYPIDRRVRQGLCRSFQVANVFGHLSLFENIAIPVIALKQKATSFLCSVKKDLEVKQAVDKILDRIGLLDHSHVSASALSHGDRRLLEVGIALAAKPKLLFLDEPTAGMNPVERTRILQNIRDLSAEGEVTFVIVEHDMDVVFSLSERVIVLYRGNIIGDGTPEQVKSNPKVREVYLGEEVA